MTYQTEDRCALCGRIVRQSNNGDGWITYCAGCGSDFPPTVEGYDRWQDYITPNGRFEFCYEERGIWRRWDMLEATTEAVKEVNLPGDLMLKHIWQEEQAQRERVAALFGQVEQLSLALAVDC
jgi:hypothetical protein